MPSPSKNQFEMSNQFTPENSALVLIDYQVGTLQLIRNNSSDQSLRNAVMLAKTCNASRRNRTDDAGRRLAVHFRRLAITGGTKHALRDCDPPNLSEKYPLLSHE